MRRQYGIHPWEIARYTLNELSALIEDLAEVQRREQEVSDGP